METESLLPYGGIKRYLRRRRYQRLLLLLDGDGAGAGGKKMKTVVRLKRRSPRRRHWKIRAVPRLKWVFMSPLKMLRKLKNGYMKFMLRSMNTLNPPQPQSFSKADAFQARLIFEISKALVASHELYPNMSI